VTRSVACPSYENEAVLRNGLGDVDRHQGVQIQGLNGVRMWTPQVLSITVAATTRCVLCIFLQTTPCGLVLIDFTTVDSASIHVGNGVIDVCQEFGIIL
jgi:succinate dehydrogenase/fumarate reductase cytochrome b subunit